MTNKICARGQIDCCDIFRREALAKEGVNLACLSNQSNISSANSKLQRSDNVILVKNLPSTTEERDLAQLFSKHGTLSRIVLPPSRTLALVEFIEAREARSAFRGLAYRRFQHTPLYLEWVGIHICLFRVETAHVTD